MSKPSENFERFISDYCDWKEPNSIRQDQFKKVFQNLVSTIFTLNKRNEYSTIFKLLNLIYEKYNSLLGTHKPKSAPEKYRKNFAFMLYFRYLFMSSPKAMMGYSKNNTYSKLIQTSINGSITPSCFEAYIFDRLIRNFLKMKTNPQTNKDEDIQAALKSILTKTQETTSTREILEYVATREFIPRPDMYQRDVPTATNVLAAARQARPANDSTEKILFLIGAAEFLEAEPSPKNKKRNRRTVVEGADADMPASAEPSEKAEANVPPSHRDVVDLNASETQRKYFRAMDPHDKELKLREYIFDICDQLSCEMDCFAEQLDNLRLALDDYIELLSDGLNIEGIIIKHLVDTVIKLHGKSQIDFVVTVLDSTVFELFTYADERFKNTLLHTLIADETCTVVDLIRIAAEFFEWKVTNILDAVDIHGMTLLILAARIPNDQQLAIVDALLKQSCNPKTLDRAGHNFLYYLIAMGRDECIQHVKTTLGDAIFNDLLHANNNDALNRLTTSKQNPSYFKMRSI